MNKPAGLSKTYFSQTHSLLYSYLISLPLFVLYEILIIISQPDPQYSVRVSVDVWFRSLLSYFGPHVLSFTLIIVAILGIGILYYERKNIPEVRLRYFVFMLAEACVYAILLALILSTAVQLLLQRMPLHPTAPLSVLQQIALSLGAGLFEELFFRVLLISGLLLLFQYIFNKRWIAYGASMLLAAVLFSLMHYIGALGDSFSLGSFLFRFLFGLALNGIYLGRGFGVAAWTHALYDIMVFVYS